MTKQIYLQKKNNLHFSDDSDVPNKNEPQVNNFF